jgi:hypothetical protein
MNSQQFDYGKLIETIGNSDIHKRFKEILLSTLISINNKSVDEQRVLAIFEDLTKIQEEMEIYKIGREFKEIVPAFYLIAKEFLRSKPSRGLFYKEIQVDYEKEIWRTSLFLGIFEFFMCNTNEIEINEIFKEDLSLFHEFFYTLVLADISEQYYESYTLRSYFEYKLWGILGKKFSKFIKLKIQKCVKNNDIGEFYKIYKNFFGSLETNELVELFSVNRTNIIPFLLKNISVDDFFELELDFDYYFSKNLELVNCISETLLSLLPNYEVKEWNDPLYLLSFFDCLTEEHVQSLINNPEFDFFELLMKNQCTESFPNDDAIKNFIREKNIDFYQLCREVIKENNLEKIYWFWDRWLLFGILDMEVIKKLLEDPSINFVERLLKAAYLYKHKDEAGLNYSFPDKLQYNLRSLMVRQITQIIKKYEKESFIPLLAMRLLDYFNPQELLDLLQNNEIDLLPKINETIENHYSEIMGLNESFYRWKISFFKFLTKFNIPVSEQIDRIEPSENLIMWLAPPDEELEISYNVVDIETELRSSKEYVSIAGRKIPIIEGVLDLSGLNLYDLSDVKGLFNLKSIKVLSLSNNFIKKLPDEIGNLTSLEHLIIEKCDLTSLPESIGKLTKIKNINLHQTNLSSLPESFGSLVNLKVLNLSFNNLHRLPNSFKHLVNLKDLNLRNNSLNDISLWIGNLLSLRKLNLMVNRNIKTIPESIGNLKSLRELILWETGIKSLPSTIKNLKKLKILDLSNTYLRAIPDWIGDLSSLEYLSCNSGSLMWHQIMEIPDSILNCASLKSLRVNRENLKTPSPVVGELRRRGVKVSH